LRLFQQLLFRTFFRKLLDWNRYLDALYAWFTQDFIDSKPVFQGRRLGLKRHPMSHGKEATFWHMIQEGKEEEQRTPDFRRCERIRWPKPIIEHDGVHPLRYGATSEGVEIVSACGSSRNAIW
jgi:hypothetical protein